MQESFHETNLNRVLLKLIGILEEKTWLDYEVLLELSKKLVLMALPKPLQTEFGIHHRLEGCVFRSEINTRQKYLKNLRSSLGVIFGS